MIAEKSQARKQIYFMTNRFGKWLDITGATASWLCAAHCLILPFFITLLPLVGLSFLLDEATERIFIGVSVALALSSFLPAYFCEHGKLRAIFLAVGGIGLITMTHFLMEENLTAKLCFLLIGAILITAAHLINRRLCHRCKVC